VSDPIELRVGKQRDIFHAGEVGYVLIQEVLRLRVGLAAKDTEIAQLRAEYDQAIEDWGRNDEQILADSQRLQDSIDAALKVISDWGHSADCDDDNCGADDSPDAALCLHARIERALTGEEQAARQPADETWLKRAAATGPDRPTDEEFTAFDAAIRSGRGEDQA
jgi:hypothetical protein